MNTNPLRLVGLTFLCVLVTGLPAQTVAPGAPSPAVNISIPSTASELASGYATAAGQMTLKGVTIHYREDSGVSVFKGIREVRAFGGVVLVTFSAGDMMALNAERIVLITDGVRGVASPPVKP